MVQRPGNGGSRERRQREPPGPRGIADPGSAQRPSPDGAAGAAVRRSFRRHQRLPVSRHRPDRGAEGGRSRDLRLGRRGRGRQLRDARRVHRLRGLALSREHGRRRRLDGGRDLGRQAGWLGPSPRLLARAGGAFASRRPGAAVHADAARRRLVLGLVEHRQSGHLPAPEPHWRRELLRIRGGAGTRAQRRGRHGLLRRPRVQRPRRLRPRLDLRLPLPAVGQPDRGDGDEPLLRRTERSAERRDELPRGGSLRGVDHSELRDDAVLPAGFAAGRSAVDHQRTPGPDGVLQQHVRAGRLRLG